MKKRRCGGSEDLKRSRRGVNADETELNWTEPDSATTISGRFLFYTAMKESANRISPYAARTGIQGRERMARRKKRPVKYCDDLERLVQSDLPFLGKRKHFICDPGEGRYEPRALMKRAEYPANTLTGPWWLLGNKAKWLLSDLLCLSTAALHLWL